MKNKKAKFWHEQVKYLPLQKPMVINESTSVKQTLTAMQKKKTGCALILDDAGKISGIFTEREFIKKLVAKGFNGKTQVKEVMNSNFVTIKENKSVEDAINEFSSHPFRHMPVMDDEDHIAGLLTITVLSDYIAEQSPEEVLNLPPDANQVSKTISGA